MKLKLLPLLTGAVILATVATPFAVKALPVGSGQFLVAQTTTQSGQGRFADLNLTQSQRTQIRQLNQETRQKIEAVLTQSQREQYRASLQDRRGGSRSGTSDNSLYSSQTGGRQNVLASLNLSQTQKTKIQEIMQSANRKMRSLLTTEQRTQLQQNRQ